MKQSFLFKGVSMAIGIAAIGPGAMVAGLATQVLASEIAAMQTITFSIKNMTCALCPVTVKTAMEGVKGVNSVQIDFAAKTATVVFDPDATTPEAIAASSTNAGYPAATKG